MVELCDAKRMRETGSSPDIPCCCGWYEYVPHKVMILHGKFTAAPESASDEEQDVPARL